MFSSSLRNDKCLPVKLKNKRVCKELLLSKLGCQNASVYPIFYAEAVKIIIPFPSSYLCEVGFLPGIYEKQIRNQSGYRAPMRFVLSDVEPQFQ